MIIINDSVVNMNRYEFIDNFMMTRLAKLPEAIGRPYELMKNISDVIFFRYSLIQLLTFMCCFHDSKRNSVQERI